MKRKQINVCIFNEPNTSSIFHFIFNHYHLITPYVTITYYFITEVPQKVCLTLTCTHYKKKYFYFLQFPKKNTIKPAT